MAAFDGTSGKFPFTSISTASWSQTFKPVNRCTITNSLFRASALTPYRIVVVWLSFPPVSYYFGCWKWIKGVQIKTIKRCKCSVKVELFAQVNNQLENILPDIHLVHYHLQLAWQTAIQSPSQMPKPIECCNRCCYPTGWLQYMFDHRLEQRMIEAVPSKVYRWFFQ